MQQRGANKTLPLRSCELPACSRKFWGHFIKLTEPDWAAEGPQTLSSRGHSWAALSHTQNGRSCSIRVPGSLIVDSNRRSLPSAARWRRLDLKPHRQRPVRRPAALTHSCSALQVIAAACATPQPAQQPIQLLPPPPPPPAALAVHPSSSSASDAAA